MKVKCPNCFHMDCFSNDQIDQVNDGDDSIFVRMYCNHCKKEFQAIFYLGALVKDEE